MVARACLKFVIGMSLILSQSLAIADVDDLSVTARQLVSKKRVSRTDIEYTYTITVSNAGAPLTGVAVAVSSLSAKTLIQEGEVVLGSLASGTTQSTDTFTMRQNRRVRFNPADLVYTFTADAPVVNLAPIADAGADQTAFVGDTVLLNGSGSSDPDGDPIVAHAWQLVSRPAASAASLWPLNTVTTSFVADQPGSYVAELIVYDGFIHANGLDGSLPDRVTITVDSVITQPSDHYSCTLEPRHFQLQVEDAPTAGQPAANYAPDSATFPGQILALDLIPESDIEGFYTDLNGNGFGDLVLRTPGSSSLQIWLSDASGLLTTPIDYPIGSNPLTALVMGDFIGDAQADIAVADSTGTIDLLEGLGGGAFINRTEHRIRVGSGVTRLISSDLDGDGDDDLLISTDVGVSVFQQENDLINRDLINNGDFSQGLSAWMSESVGHESGQLAGVVELANGGVLLSENSSFRTTLKQSFIIPDPAGNLTFDLLSVNLDDPQGGIPDAFEVSLLDANNNPVVPTIETAATAFLNVNPGGAERLATGVTKSGTLVTLDLSAATPGTAVTLYFDLIGNPPSSDSTASIGHVNAGDVVTPIDSFTGSDLSGPFTALAGVGSCDVDSDGLADILVHDSGSYQLLIYGLDPNGAFSRRQTISLSGI